jgi:hypothetical protein
VCWQRSGGRRGTSGSQPWHSLFGGESAAGGSRVTRGCRGVQRSHQPGAKTLVWPGARAKGEGRVKSCRARSRGCMGRGQLQGQITTVPHPYCSNTPGVHFNSSFPDVAVATYAQHLQLLWQPYGWETLRPVCAILHTVLHVACAPS